MLMDNDLLVWVDIARKNELKETNLDHLASAWQTDLDLDNPAEVTTRKLKVGSSEL